MKLAEALVKIKDLKGKFTDIQRGLHSDSVFEQVDLNTVVPDITRDITNLVNVSEEISKLKSRVTKTNAANGLTDKIHTMEHLRSCVSQLNDLTYNKQEVVNLRSINYSEQAVKLTTYATYDVRELKKTINKYRDNIRELDLTLQRLNWEVDLVD